MSSKDSFSERPSQPTFEMTCRLIDFFLENHADLFHNDYLNSEGRKLFEKIIKNMLESFPSLKRTIRNVRKSGREETVLEFLKSLRQQYCIIND